MTTPIALNVLDDIEARLQAIDGAGDFHNALTGRVYVGREYQDDDDVPYLAIIEGGDDPFEATVSSLLVQEAGEYVIQGLCRVTDFSKPLHAGHLLLADIKRALFLAPAGPEFEQLASGATLNYTGRQVFQRDAGGTLCEVHLLLRVTHGERYGRPDDRG